MTNPVTRVQIGRHFAPLDQYAGKGGWAIITAFNPGARLSTSARNEAASAALDLRIQQTQTGARVKTIHRDTEPEGTERWPDEHGWLFGFDVHEQVHRLALDFEQAAVVTGHINRPATLWVYGDAWPDRLPTHARKIAI